MVTAQLTIKPHLAEYLNSKYFDAEHGCIVLPDKLDLYHTIWDLLEKRPINRQVDVKGNVTLGLPNRREGKDPSYFNYLGERSIKIINNRVETMFFAELRQELDDNKQKHGTVYLDTAHTFMCKYCIESISSDALIKDFQRWREIIRQRKERRKYTRKNQ